MPTYHSGTACHSGYYSGLSLLRVLVCPTCGSGTPLAVLDPSGTWKARMPKATPFSEMKTTRSWSLQARKCDTRSSSAMRAPALPRVPRRCDSNSATGMRLM